VTTDDAHATGPVPEREPGAEGTMVGRYLLLQRLGGGGGGEVYSAFDPVLDRKVALKFLHRSEHTGPALIREGRLLAKVVHRAVVEVHEVAFHDGRAFMAMELVDRGDLDAFAAEARAKGDVASLLAALYSVAEGIIAAHAVGVVHGDIKPSNVLRGTTGEFKVSDFGIARLRRAELDDDASDHPIGTPAFMAPEQHLGGQADERSDQYSFCVTAWSALCGSLPFLPGPTIRSTTNDSLDATGPVESLESIKAAGPPPWPAPRGVPRWIGDVLSRGLRSDPAERWPSMQDLLAALRPDPARARLRRVLGVGGGLAVAAAGVYGWSAYDHGRREENCRRSGAEIDAVWNADASAALRDTLLATDVRHAASTADKVVPWLDDAARAWREHRTAACSHTEVAHTWSPETFARAQWCLDERKLELEAALQRLEGSDAATVDRAVALVSRLRTDAGCIDEAALAQMPDPPAGAMRSTTIEALAEIARARALDHTGKYDEGLAAIRRAKEILHAHPGSPLSATAAVEEGRLLAHGGFHAEAEQALIGGWVAAASSRSWTVAAVAAENLVFVVGRELHRPGEGATWETQAKVAATLGGDPSGLHAAGRAANLAVVKREAGEYDEAIALHMRAIELTTEALGEDHPTTATTLGNLAAVYVETGKPREARALFERVAQMRDATLGPDNPSTISALNNLATTFADTGEYARAKELLQDVAQRRERALRADHPLVAEALDNLGTIHTLLGEYDEAQRLLDRALAIKQEAGQDGMPLATTLAHLATVQSAKGKRAQAVELLERTLAIREQVKGPDHRIVAETLVNLGTEHFIDGDLARAEQMFARAKTIYEAAFGDAHPGVAAALNNLADVALESGRYDDAAAMYERANGIWTASYGPEHPHAATALAHWGAARLRQGRPADARPLLERAVAAFEAVDGADEQEATARFDLAKALVATQGDRAQAVALAEQARDTVARLGTGQMLHVEEIDAWLSETR
jgi:tetratricopeptide (TPR) repeat protein